MRLALTGRAAWLAWLFVHVFYLIGFRNRTAVLAQWAWNYIFSRRESRLITERSGSCATELMRGVGGQEENASVEPAVSGRSARNWHAA